MKDMMQHLGYYGSVHFDDEEPIFYEIGRAHV